MHDNCKIAETGHVILGQLCHTFGTATYASDTKSQYNTLYTFNLHTLLLSTSSLCIQPRSRVDPFNSKLATMTYKPSEHGGLKENGEPDKRTSGSHGFANDPERASELGKEGGKTQPEEVYKPSEHGGKKKDGTEDSRTSSEHGFGGDRERASEEGKKGGSK